MGIKFFRKNLYDITNTRPVTTITDSVATDTGEDFTVLMRNRNMQSGWMTTGSADAGNTTIEIDFLDLINFNRILIINHNLKSFTVKYWDEGTSMWTNFSTPINPTANTEATNYYEFDSVDTSKVQIAIAGTQVPDAEKIIRELIFTDLIGEFTIQPEIEPIFDKDRKETKFLSGRSFIAKQVGGWGIRLRKKSVSNENDLALAETLFNYYEGFLVWLCGGDVSQYETIRQGYRMEDVIYMACKNEYEPVWLDGYYKNGMELDLRLVEVN